MSATSPEDFEADRTCGDCRLCERFDSRSGSCMARSGIAVDLDEPAAPSWRGTGKPCARFESAEVCPICLGRSVSESPPLCNLCNKSCNRAGPMDRAALIYWVAKRAWTFCRRQKSREMVDLREKLTRAQMAERSLEEARRLHGALHDVLCQDAPHSHTLLRNENACSVDEIRKLKERLDEALEQNRELRKSAEVCREVASDIVGLLPLAPEAISSMRSERDEFKRRIDAALEFAGSRWEEWGERALRVAEILEGR